MVSMVSMVSTMAPPPMVSPYVIDLQNSTLVSEIEGHKRLASSFALP
jgi:hypothetical protein